MLERALADVAHGAVFGLFAVLDGSRTIEKSPSVEHYFELRYVHDSSVDVLCGPNGAILHELL